MYARLVTTSSGKKKVVYLRLLEKVKENGRWKERVLCNLGRQDIEGRRALGNLLKSLGRFSDEVWVSPEEIESREAKDYGAVLVGQKLWREIGMEGWVKQHCGRVKKGSLGEPGVLAMVLNRLTAPRSKLSLGDWMSRVYLPCWQNKSFAVRQPKAFAQAFYRTMDWLMEGKEGIEHSIAQWAKTLFPVSVVFYDITNVQFEGWEKLKQARYGYVRLGRKNHKQVLVGMVMIEGLPVACHIFRGNRAEKSTLLWVRSKVKKHFNVERLIFVVDRGMISEKSLLEIESGQDGYIVAIRRRGLEEVDALLEQEPTTFTPILVSNEEEVLLSAWEAPKASGKRRIVVLNPWKASEDRKKRESVIVELKQQLEELQKRAEKMKGKKNQKLIASAEEILNHRHGKRYFFYSVNQEGKFEFSLNSKVIAREEKLDGKFIVKTTEQGLSLKEVVFKYKELMKVEDSFRDLKDFIRVAPIYHWKWKRVQAHIFICELALLLECYLEQKLKKAGIRLSARKLFEKLQSIKVVTNQVGHLLIKYVTPPNPELETLLSVCGIFKLPKMLSDYQRKVVRLGSD